MESSSTRCDQWGSYHGWGTEAPSRCSGCVERVLCVCLHAHFNQAHLGSFRGNMPYAQIVP